MKFELVREYDDFDPVHLGTVEKNIGDINGKIEIMWAWDEFQEDDPDCDSDFIKFLKEHYQYKITKSNLTTVYLG